MTNTTASAGEHDRPLRGRLRVEIVGGDHAGKGIEVEPGDVVQIGSQAECALCVPDATVSRRHLEVRGTRSGALLTDLGSRNGSFVAGNRFTELAVRPPLRVRVGTVELQLLEVDDDAVARLGSLVATSAAMRRVFGLARAAAATSAPVMITGETGTGKEGLARAIHAESARAAEPYVVLDLGSVTRTLLESELFGHVRGAFTDAVADRAGAFESAGRGTVFLDELGELALESQTRLLRVLESGEVRRVGSTRVTQTRARVVAATNRALQTEIEAGRFRADLYHRLAVVTIELPPLRERLEDLPVLIGEITTSLPGGLGIDLPPETEAAMAAYGWPGNVRQLRNVLERAAVIAAGGRITPELLGLTGAPGPSDDEPFKESKQRLVDAWERDYLRRLLARSQGNVTAAARAAGIARVHLYRLLAKHRIDLPEE